MFKKKYVTFYGLAPRKDENGNPVLLEILVTVSKEEIYVAHNQTEDTYWVELFKGGGWRIKHATYEKLKKILNPEVIKEGIVENNG
jgi:hypothetical protein